MSTKTPFTVFDFADRPMTVKSTKALAVKYAIAQDAEYVTSPSGSTVWANPNGKIRRDHETPTAKKASGKPSTTTNKEDKDMTATTEAAEKAPKAKKEKPEGGCSLRRLSSRAARSGAEICNAGKVEEGFSVDVFPAGSEEGTTFTAPSAREAYGAALVYVKTLPVIAKAEASDAA